MTRLIDDLVFSGRALRRAPLLLAAAVATLAIGIGVSTGVLAVAYGTLLRPLPFGDPARLVMISVHRSNAPHADIGVPLPQVEEWRRRGRAFSALAAHGAAQFTIRGAGDPRSERGAMVTDGFFQLLGVSGDERRAVDLRAAAPAVAVGARLARQLDTQADWRARGLSIGTGHFAVAAVMPPWFDYPSEQIAFWIPAQAAPTITLFSGEDHRDFHLIARLAPGVTLAQAQDDASRVAEELNAGLPEGRRRYASVKAIDAALRESARTTVLPFMAGAALVLAIACANVSGLLIGRATARRREFAVRRALGGGGFDLASAAFAEAIVIAVCGWALGLGIGQLVVRAFKAFGPGAIGTLQGVRLDATIVALSALVVALVVLACGAAPALRALGSDPGAVLKGTPASARSGGAARGSLVAAQIALTVVLLVCAGLLARTVMTIVQAERGFELRHGLAARLMLAETVRYDVSDRAAFVERLLAEVRTLSGVTAAGVGSDLPPRGTQLQMTIRVVRDQESDVFPLSFAAVTPGYLEALGASLVQGRLFDASDRGAAVPPVVITQAAARRMFQNEQAIGKTWPASIPTPAGRVKPLIVGVIRDVKYGGLDREAPASIFVPWERVAPSQAYLLARTVGDPRALAASVTATIRRLDPQLPVFPPQSLEEVVAGSIAERRLRVQLAVTFALLAVLLASVAVWAAVAQAVADRRRELAIRMALGSTDGAAVRLIVGQGAIVIAAGVAVGVLGAALSARALRHLLHGVAPLDPATFAAAATRAAVLAAAACYGPARRAASVSPAELLREG